MEEFNNYISNYLPYIAVGLVIAVLILLILIIVLFSSLSKLQKKYIKFMRGASAKNVEEMITSYLDKVHNAIDTCNETKEMLANIEERVNGCVQKVSVIRYKAFEDVGSDLSFSIALLDSNYDGVILTGIYGRHDSTTYAKPIDKGISRYELSEEEQFVLKEAMNK